MKWITLWITLALAGCGDSGSNAGSAPTPMAAAQAQSGTVYPTPAPTGPVVFIGDSITQFWDWGGPDPGIPLAQLVPGEINAGIAGNLTSQMLARFQTDVLSHNPSVVVILGGVNDILKTPSPTIDNIASMAEQASAQGATVVIGLVMPVTGYWQPPYEYDSTAAGDAAIQDWDQQLRDLAAAYGYHTVDYYDAVLLPDGSQNTTLFVDGLHPDAAGHLAMWSVLHPMLDSLGVTTSAQPTP